MWMAAMGMAIGSNGHQPPGDPLGPGGPFSLATPEANRALGSAAGFSDVHVEEIEGTFRFDDFDDSWNLQSEVAGPIALCISTLGSADVAGIRETLAPMLEPYRNGNAYEIPTLVVAVRAS
jgi:hypothetical protein